MFCRMILSGICRRLLQSSCTLATCRVGQGGPHLGPPCRALLLVSALYGTRPDTVGNYLFGERDPTQGTAMLWAGGLAACRRARLPASRQAPHGPLVPELRHPQMLLLSLRSRLTMGSKKSCRGPNFKRPVVNSLLLEGFFVYFAVPLRVANFGHMLALRATAYVGLPELSSFELQHKHQAVLAMPFHAIPAFAASPPCPSCFPHCRMQHFAMPAVPSARTPQVTRALGPAGTLASQNDIQHKHRGIALPCSVCPRASTR